MIFTALHLQRLVIGKGPSFHLLEPENNYNGYDYLQSWISSHHTWYGIRKEDFCFWLDETRWKILVIQFLNVTWHSKYNFFILLFERYEVQTICYNTLLGSLSTVAGQSITLEMLRKKPAMIEAMRMREPHEAPLLDTGEVPGDHLGAAGFDSAFFAHLKVWKNVFNVHSCVLAWSFFFCRGIGLTTSQQRWSTDWRCKLRKRVMEVKQPSHRKRKRPIHPLLRVGLLVCETMLFVLLNVLHKTEQI